MGFYWGKSSKQANKIKNNLIRISELLAKRGNGKRPKEGWYSDEYQNSSALSGVEAEVLFKGGGIFREGR